MTVNSDNHTFAGHYSEVPGDYFKTSLHSFEINVKDPITNDDGVRIVIDKIFYSLTGKTFNKATASLFDIYVYDVLLIAEWNDLDQSDHEQRVENLKTLGKINSFSTFFAASMITQILLEETRFSDKERINLIKARDFFSNNLHQLLKDNPEILKLVDHKNLQASEDFIDQIEIKEKVKVVQKEKNVERIFSKNRHLISIFFLALCIGQVAAQEVTKAQVAPSQTDDLCKSPDPSFCEGNLGIPRDQMPQLKPNIAPKFIDYWKSKNVTVTHQNVPATHLHSTQSEISAKKVQNFVNEYKLRTFNPCEASILVAQSDHVLDGHHRWAACKLLEVNMNIVKIEASIVDLITATRGFEGIEYHNLNAPSKIIM